MVRKKKAAATKKKATKAKPARPTPTKKKAPANKRGKREKQIHVLTDGTGGLPRHTLTALLSQFPTLKKRPRYHVFCSTPKKIEEVFGSEITRGSIVFHSLVDLASKAKVEQLAEKKKLPCYDLTGGAVTFLAEATGCKPLNDMELVHTRDADYFDRIDAWEYTMQHDDSRRLESIDKADIVLLGLSRVSKTPTSAYLGWLGYKVANVSFAPECGVPSEIKKSAKKVVALTMQPKQLSEIRRRRMRVNGFAQAFKGDRDNDPRYAELRDTVKECTEAERIFRQLNVPTIDVTHSTVEETAAKVLEVMHVAPKRTRRKTRKRSTR